mmetsp:Transcript_35182/g.80249  ORF Transcript_35182/g.80249 Transcript_35182/m.80249 type:complete len:290 (+) Transcript_35182:2468-3337(+)
MAPVPTLKASFPPLTSALTRPPRASMEPSVCTVLPSLLEREKEVLTSMPPMETVACWLAAKVILPLASTVDVTEPDELNSTFFPPMPVYENLEVPSAEVTSLPLARSIWDVILPVPSDWMLTTSLPRKDSEAPADCDASIDIFPFSKERRADPVPMLTLALATLMPAILTSAAMLLLIFTSTPFLSMPTPNPMSCLTPTSATPLRAMDASAPANTLASARLLLGSTITLPPYCTLAATGTPGMSPALRPMIWSAWTVTLPLFSTSIWAPTPWMRPPTTTRSLETSRLTA